VGIATYPSDTETERLATIFRFVLPISFRNLLVVFNGAVMLFLLGFTCSGEQIAGYGVAEGFYRIFGMSV